MFLFDLCEMKSGVPSDFRLDAFMAELNLKGFSVDMQPAVSNFERRYFDTIEARRS